MSYLDVVSAMVDEIRASGRYRELQTHAPSGAVDFSSNDYLDLSTNPKVVQALRRATRAGAGGAWLLGGRHREHSLLEEELAGWLGRERALLFSSGYHAAVGAIPVLGRVTTTIYSDALNHACLIDGMRLTRNERIVFPHRQLPRRGERKPGALIVTESIFGMDGDVADVSLLLRDLGDDDVLFLDEAHALGITGAHGAGLARELNDPRLVIMGTLSKTFGAHGGFIAGPAKLIALLINSARTFIFDSALPPAVALAARIALAIIKSEDGERARFALYENVRRLRARLHEPDAEEFSPVVPIVVGSEERALTLSASLLKERLYVPAIRPPTVPAGSSRLRVSVRSGHTAEQIDLLARRMTGCIAI
jgi:8-amino-7-oxononanoate synthase